MAFEAEKPGDASFLVTVGDPVGKLGKTVGEAIRSRQKARVAGFDRAGFLSRKAHGIDAEAGIEPVELGLEKPRDVNGIARGQ